MIKTVESLESHGTEWIDTGIEVKPNRRIVVDFEFTEIINDTWVAGASNNPIQIGYFAGIYNNQLYTGNSAQYSPNQLGVGIRVTAIMNTVYDISRTIYLFGRNWDNVANGFAYCKIYSAQIYDNNELIADYAPFTNTDTGVSGMYDRISGTFYYNQGGGAFTPHIGWETINGTISHGHFIPQPESYMAKPYPHALWRIDTDSVGFPYNELSNNSLMLGAFANATHLTRVSIPRSCKKIGREAFRNTQLASVTIARDCEYYPTSFPDGCVVNFYPD